MIYLLLAVLSSALVAITMRISKKYCENDISMLAINYACCTILATLFMGVGNFEFERSSIALGVLQGIMYLASFIIYQYNINKNGVVLSATFMKLGVLVPTLAAIFFFHEKPTIIQLFGVALAIFAIIFINYEKGDEKVSLKKSLIILLIGGGLTDFMAKIYEEVGSAQHKNQFIFYTFFVAMILGAAMAKYKGEKLTRNDVLCGIIVGVPNYFSAFFLLRAVHYIIATIAYSTYSVATIACTTLAGVILFREHLSRKQFIGLGVILVALICLNL